MNLGRVARFRGAVMGTWDTAWGRAESKPDMLGVELLRHWHSKRVTMGGFNMLEGKSCGT